MPTYAQIKKRINYGIVFCIRGTNCGYMQSWESCWVNKVKFKRLYCRDSVYIPLLTKWATWVSLVSNAVIIQDSLTLTSALSTELSIPCLKATWQQQYTCSPVLFFIYLTVFNLCMFTCMDVRHRHAWCLRWSEDRIRSLGIGVIGGCDLPVWVWGTEPGSPGKKNTCS